MDWLRLAAIGLVLAAAVPACSSQSSTRDDASRDEGEIGEVAQAITAVCSFDTVGLPCDPDGPAGPKLECEGACTIGTAGNVSCQPATAGSLNGVVCGTTNGVGDNACKRYCSGKTCLKANAPLGAACRPDEDGNPCDGQCTGAGVCEALATPCEFGREDQLCKFKTCTFANASQCITTNLRKTTLCSDQDACSIGACNASGVCVAGPTIGCDDGNSCTDDSCDPEDGGCVGVNNDANSCSDGNACTTGEFCSSGQCVAGADAVDCDDNNACTADSCDPNTGCAHIANSCSDNNACTDDACDPSDGSCSHSEKICNDGNACTLDACDAVLGCVFTPMNCDDANACTTDSCGGGVCSHEQISCDDNDVCTVDVCTPAGGCQNAPIADCGVGGASGAGGEGGTATGGMAGDTAIGGAGGEPGTGGVASGGEPGSGGGEPATGGMPGGAGEPGEPGGSSTAGSANAGTESGGSSATAGSASGGTANAGTDGTDPNRTVQESSSCGCKTAGGPSSSSTGALLIGMVGLALLRRRRAA